MLTFSDFLTFTCSKMAEGSVRKMDIWGGDRHKCLVINRHRILETEANKKKVRVSIKMSWSSHTGSPRVQFRKSAVRSKMFFGERVLVSLWREHSAEGSSKLHTPEMASAALSNSRTRTVLRSQTSGKDRTERGFAGGVLLRGFLRALAGGRRRGRVQHRRVGIIRWTSSWTPLHSEELGSGR